MHSLSRNKQKIYYALYQGVTDRVVDNLHTGEKVISYSDPTEYYINVSGAIGKDEVTEFGINTPYDRIMSTSDMSCPIDEKTLLWIGISQTAKANYRVAAKRESLNEILYAIEKTERK